MFRTKDPKAIVANIRLMMNKDLIPEQSLLFLDEIQAVPKVLACLRYFYEEMPSLHVIAAGSLLDIELAVPEFSMPVGRISYMHIYPMSFTEFLCAVGEKSLAEYVEQWQVGDEIIAPVHDKLMGLLWQNMAVGGMPEAVKVFSESSDYRHCEVIKQDLMLVNQGALAEQWVGQELLNSLDTHQPPHLHYWARESRSSSAEVDYVIAGDKPVPIEVKAGKTGSLKSLHLFMQEKSTPLAIRLNADMPSLMLIDHLQGGEQEAGDESSSCRLLSLPLYMAGQIRRLVEMNRL